MRAFQQCGEVVETKLILDRETGRSRGFAFVVMSNPEEAQRAISQMNGADLDGRALRVNEAEERKPRSGGGGGFGGGGGGGFGGSRGGGRGGSDRRNRF
jgi:RNA recognition motif-containing protein